MRGQHPGPHPKMDEYGNLGRSCDGHGDPRQDRNEGEPSSRTACGSSVASGARSTRTPQPRRSATRRARCHPLRHGAGVRIRYVRTHRRPGVPRRSRPAPRRGRDRDQGWPADDRGAAWCATRAARGCARASRRVCGRSGSTTSICTRCTGPTRTLPEPRPPVHSKNSSRTGKIRHVGVSNFDVAEMAEFAADTAGGNAPAAVQPVPPGHRGRGVAVHPRTRHRRARLRAAGPRVADGEHGRTNDVRPDDWRSTNPSFTVRRSARTSKGPDAPTLRVRGARHLGRATRRGVDAREPGGSGRDRRCPTAQHIEEAIAATNCTSVTTRSHTSTASWPARRPSSGRRPTDADTLTTAVRPANPFLDQVRRRRRAASRPARPAPAAPARPDLVTGLVDAFSYLVLGHVFVANMTGNVVFLGFAIAGAPGSPSRRRSSRWVRSWAARPWAARPFRALGHHRGRLLAATTTRSRRSSSGLGRACRGERRPGRGRLPVRVDRPARHLDGDPERDRAEARGPRPDDHRAHIDHHRCGSRQRDRGRSRVGCGPSPRGRRPRCSWARWPAWRSFSTFTSSSRSRSCWS